MNCPKCGTNLELKIVSGASGPVAPKSAVYTEDIGDMLDAINMDSLNDWGKKFVTDLRERYEKYGERTHVSDKQRTKLEELVHGGGF